MYKLEKKIIDNQPYFNDQEPDQGHRDRFAAKLSHGGRSKRRRITVYDFMKVAAVIVLLISVSYLLLKPTTIAENGRLYITQIEIPEDMVQIQDYYEELSTAKFDEIDGLAQNEDEAKRVKAVAKKKMDKLDSKLAVIEKEYMKNPQSEELKEAIISNKKLKADVVNNIVEQMDKAQRGYHAGSMYTNF